MVTAFVYALPIMVLPVRAGSAAMFEFDELCNRPLAAADYIALADRFHTVAVADVPIFAAANRAAAYRFVTLIDVMYEHRWVATAGEPQCIQQGTVVLPECHPVAPPRALSHDGLCCVMYITCSMRLAGPLMPATHFSRAMLRNSGYVSSMLTSCRSAPV